MNSAARAVIDDIPEQPDSPAADTGDALMITGETVLSITATCAGIRTQMVRDQGWSEEFSEAFAQDLARGLVSRATDPAQNWVSGLEGL